MTLNTFAAAQRASAPQRRAMPRGAPMGPVLRGLSLNAALEREIREVVIDRGAYRRSGSGMPKFVLGSQ